MGEENSAKETVANEAKSALVEAYKDVGRPVLAPLGKTLGTAFEVALAPVDLIFGGLKAGVDRFKAALKKKVEKVPPERLLPPPPTIAAPAALQYALMGEGAEAAILRDMFENLVARSMDIETTKDVHPAFVTMISQLTPDEARLLQNMKEFEYTLLQVRSRVDPPEWTIVSLFSHGLDIDRHRLETSVSNLERLGILRFDSAPEEIATHNMDQLDAIAKAVSVPGEAISIYGDIHFTPLGEQFVDTCVRDQRA